MLPRIRPLFLTRFTRLPGLAPSARRLALLLPLALALLHASGAWPLALLDRLDALVHDSRQRLLMPGTRDPRIVIVDIDEKSLAEVGRWPWGRDRMARLADELFDRQQVAAVGFDVVFAEPDESSGLARLQALARGPLRDQPGFAARLRELAPELDHDARFARALTGRPVVLGYYFNQDPGGHGTGVLPPPALDLAAVPGRFPRADRWRGHAANIAPLAEAAPRAGFFNPRLDADGLVRSMPLLAEYRGRYYESLALALLREANGRPALELALPDGSAWSGQRGVDALRLRQAGRVSELPLDDGLGVRVPYRGPGGPDGGAFTYVSAADLLAGRLPAGQLQGRIVLVGTTAPGLQDLRATPAGEAYPGVEIHASLLSGLLDGRVRVRPDYAPGYDVLVLCIAGLLLALRLPRLSAARALALGAGVLAAAAGLNTALYLGLGLVLPLAAALAMALSMLALHMGWGYFTESRHKRELATLFGTYVPPELVQDMLRSPDGYSMQARNQELTVMFCDMRGFTRMAERMEPSQLQALLNEVFTRLTEVILAHRGTIDKYMGDCVMAFWGAPVEAPDHASLAVAAALALAGEVDAINASHRERGLPPVGVGVGLNTGVMCVGDMGSRARRAYTVIGDAVNLASRLEGLSSVYGVAVVASEATCRAAPDFHWMELDRVRVKGRERAVTLFHPLAPAARPLDAVADELRHWAAFLVAYRSQDWASCLMLLPRLPTSGPRRALYALYEGRVAGLRQREFDPAWDGTTRFETK